MKFSIVTISYNQALFLEEAIESVLGQRGVELEYIVVDPGSTDGSREIVERYRDQIDHVVFEPDKGPGDGLNKGFQRASGQIYGYLNSDDRLLPGALSAIAREFCRHPAADVVSGHAYVIDEQGKRLQRVFSDRFQPRLYAAGCCVLIQQATFFRQRAFARTGGFNPDNRIAWDGELAVDLALAGSRFVVTQQTLAEFRYYRGSISASSDYAARHEADHARVAGKIGVADVSVRTRSLLNAYRWMRQPATLAARIVDGIKHPARVL